jgi:hypothetical protein
MKQQKNQVTDELDKTRKELEASKDECADVENKLRDARTEVHTCAFLPFAMHVLTSRMPSVKLVLRSMCPRE